MSITSEIAQAYRLCPRKAFLSLYPSAESASRTPNAYVHILEKRANVSRSKHLEAIRQQFRDARPYDPNLLGDGRRALIEATIHTGDLEAHCDVLTRAKTKSRLGRYSYEPTIVVGTQGVTSEQKTALSFAGYVLGEVQGNVPAAGALVNREGRAERIQLAGSYKNIETMIGVVRGWLANRPAEPPPIILNKHCPYCPFRNECTEQAVKEGNLSLLDRMTPKLMKKYQKKRIFTIQQLSFLFRPRKSRKNPRSAKFSPELQALALRTNKTYLTEPQSYERSAVELFLDFEGIPDERFNYLLGLLIVNGDSAAYRSFWADSREQEQRMWDELLAALGPYPDAPIYHYGNYEAKAIHRFHQRYGGAPETLTKRLVNVNSWIYGKVYFPVRSNRLKDLGKFLGARWSSPEASGLQALVWRHQWEETGDDHYKQSLITYNEEDCRALRLLVDTLSRLKNGLESNPAIDLADRPKRTATGLGEEIHKQFDWICRSARADYDRNKINLHRSLSQGETKKQGPGGRKAHRFYRRLVPRAVGKVVRVLARRNCPRHHGHPLKKTGRAAEHTVIDLVFARNGCRKTTIRYEGEKRFCSNCGSDYNPPGITKLGKNILYGRSFRAWVIYQKIVLRLPYHLIIRVMEDMFCERMGTSIIVYWIGQFATEYRKTERVLVERLLESPFIHIDETRINIRGTDHYVWVFTDGRHVVFRMTETREATIVHEFLKGYQGVLVSDFYPGYDSVPCRQQKCWVHLIGDLNEDLWENPFNVEFETFVSEIRNLIVPILEGVEKYGLKKRNLGKFKKAVEHFYDKTIDNRVYESEVTQTYQKRFERYRESLFVFLEQDNVPWNNNTAERALRELAIQRKIAGSFFKRVAPQYLLLLGLAQSCRFQGKSFLKFLLSKEKDLDVFRSTMRKKIAIPVGPRAAGGGNPGRCAANEQATGAPITIAGSSHENGRAL